MQKSICSFLSFWVVFQYNNDEISLFAYIAIVLQKGYTCLTTLHLKVEISALVVLDGKKLIKKDFFSLKKAAHQ
jgi:hypothetical protein